MSEAFKESPSARARKSHYPGDSSTRITDNWLELTVRFLSRDRGIRELKDAMSREIFAALDEAGIGIASTTFDVVGLPPLRLDERLAAEPTAPFPYNHATKIAVLRVRRKDGRKRPAQPYEEAEAPQHFSPTTPAT